MQRQEANFWSKYNCPVLQWTTENPRHGFGNLDDPAPRNDQLKRERITLPAFRRDGTPNSAFSSTSSSTPAFSQSNYTAIRSSQSTRTRAASPSSEPPAKQMKLSTQKHGISATPVEPSPTPKQSSEDKGDCYFISSSESLRQSCASVFPQFAQEHHIDLGHSNKIFAARWLSDDRIVMGTKCNSILVMDANNRKPKSSRPRALRVYEDEDEGDGREDEDEVTSRRQSVTNSFLKIQPLKSSGEMPLIEQICGIHAIDVNPSGTLFASGGYNPADVSVFRLPNFEPLTVGETAHSDWLFDLEWLDDEYLVSGKLFDFIYLFNLMVSFFR